MEEFDGFDWDQGNREHCQKHGVSIAEIEALFRSTPRVAPDPKHSDAEQRLLAIGPVGERHIFAAFTFRNRGGKRLLRPISCRYISRKDIPDDEETTASPDDR